MRLTFILMRLPGYLVVFLSSFWHASNCPWWQWGISLFATAWGVWDHWKQPDSPVRVLRKGVWAEALIITLWAVIVQNGSILFLLISPLARACIHLTWVECLPLLLLSVLTTVGVNHWLDTSGWLRWTQMGSFIGIGMYTYVIGELVRNRDRLRRMAMVTSFEREEQMKNEERVRIAGQLHDVMGQYWAAVVRALDVAMAVDGAQRLTFISRAREAALSGLSEMRQAVHLWNEGQQTPAEWIGFLNTSLTRFSKTCGVDVFLYTSPVEWKRCTDPLRTAEAISRIVIESVTNGIRHGAASSIEIKITATQNELRTYVQDNGLGISHRTTQSAPSGIGMKNMEQLATSVGGTLEIQSTVGRGTTVVFRVPLIDVCTDVSDTLRESNLLEGREWNV